MSDTVQHQEADDRTTPAPTMFPGREVPIAPDAPAVPHAPTAAREAALDAVERALAASLRLQRTMPAERALPSELPAAPQLDEKETWLRRRETRSEDDVAVRRMRARPSLTPVAMAVPPADERTSAGALLAGIIGAVALAALAALFVVGALPLLFGAKAEGEGASTSLWSRIFPEPSVPQQDAASPPKVERAPAVSPEQAALVERFVALRQQAEQSQAIVPQPVKTARVVMPAAPSVRALEADEIAVLYDRSQGLIEQGDIASARLTLTRAAEAGDARSALALGTTYDPGVLRKLGVIGVAADIVQAQAWYNKAVELGSPDAALRLERLAQAAR